ncbi:MAG: hypothetical protein HQ472_04850 [Ignavibacteria bacterium]|nr:hypothetical protein [Ignavibacteria bacterium]
MRYTNRTNLLLAFILSAFLGFLASSSAAENLGFPAFTSAPVGSIIRIPVSGTVTSTGILTISIQYTPTMMRVLGVYGGPSFAFRCAGKFNPIVDSSAGRTGFYSVECGAVQPIVNGPLFEVEVELLNGPDTSGVISITQLVANDSVIADAEFVPGTVNVEGGNTLRPNEFLGIGMVYPNPIASSFTVSYVVATAGTAKFDLFSSGGRLAFELGTSVSHKGVNTVQFTPKLWEISQGSLLLRMVTEDGTYFYPVMVVK